MKRNNIHKTVTELFGGEYKYIVPLYQRNFAWGDAEITQLLQDLYENFKSDRTYFVGSLIYLNRKSSGILEVIDGQQRLTVLTLLLNVLGKDLLPNLSTSKLIYDSRDEVTEYLNGLYSATPLFPSEEDPSEVIKTFQTAYATLVNCSLDPKEEQISLQYLRDNDYEKLEHFTNYITNRVYFVLAEMPDDTDVATYFEIMNNTGEQLRKHEIVKSLLLSSAKDKGATVSEMESLAMIWDACSQMEQRIQEIIPATKRELLFGENYEGFYPENITKLVDTKAVEMEKDEGTLETIIKNDVYNKPVEHTAEKDDSLENNGSAIIDYTNFLMHVLRLCHNDEYVVIKGKGNDIPLNEKDLIAVFYSIKDKIDTKEFIARLLYYRIIFDRYIVRTEEKNSGKRWELGYLKKHSDNNGLYPRNTFGKGNDDDIDKANEKAIKALSMLQVSYPQRKYKRFLNDILSWFEYGVVKYDYNWFMPKINHLIQNYIIEIEKRYGEDLYNLGTSTPRFVLNLIDYLYYIRENESNFDFRYYNSVEHHLPQSRERYSRIEPEILNSIGNLFLLSRRANSSLNDGDPVTKAQKTFDTLKTLPPNRKYIYKRTIDTRKWDADDIKLHEKEIRELLSQKNELLEIKELEESNLLYRACMAMEDYCDSEKGHSKYGCRFNFTDLKGEKAQASLEKVKKWQNINLDRDLNDCIEEQLQTNKELLKDSWRKCFAKYPSIMDFCSTGNFTWNKDGQEIYLLTGDRVADKSRELHCHLFFEKCLMDCSLIHINQYGVWIFLDNPILKQNYPYAHLKLHIWVDTDKQKWCYEVWSERGANARENITLVRKGWVKNSNGHFYLSWRPFLCDSSKDYEKSVEQALNCYKEILGKIDSDLNF